MPHTNERPNWLAITQALVIGEMGFPRTENLHGELFAVGSRAFVEIEIRWVLGKLPATVRSVPLRTATGYSMVVVVGEAVGFSALMEFAGR